MQGDALVLRPELRAHLVSYRLVNHLETLVQYLAAGAALDTYGRAYKRMGQAMRRGDADWYGLGEQYFERSGTEFRLRDEFYRSGQSTIVDSDLALSIESAPDRSVARVPLSTASLLATNEVLPMLAGRIPYREYAASLSDEGSRMIDWLRRSALVEFAAPALRREVQPGISWLGHHGVTVCSAQTTVWVDPVLSLRHRRHKGGWQQLTQRPDAVVLTSARGDQCHIDTLAHLPRSTPIWVPAPLAGPSLDNVELFALLQELGFKQIGLLRPWDALVIGDVTIVGVSYRGDGLGPDARADRLVLHVQAQGRSALLCGEAGSDQRGGMEPIMGRVRDELPPVDQLFVSFAEIWRPIALFTRRPFYLGPGMEQSSASAHDVARWCRILGCSRVVAYGGGAFTHSDLRASAPCRGLYAGFERRGDVATLQKTLSGTAAVLLPRRHGAIDAPAKQRCAQ